MKTIWPRIRGLVLFGWAVALLRFAFEATLQPGKSDVTWFFGVYFFMAIAFVVTGIRGTLADVRWPRIALMAVAIGLLVWALPNVVVYTTGQFMGWTHGRFEPQEQGLPVAETPLAKLGVGIATGMLTAIGGIVWSLLWMTVAIWLPGYVRRRRQR